jgi:hypothetical protein
MFIQQDLVKYMCKDYENKGHFKERYHMPKDMPNPLKHYNYSDLLIDMVEDHNMIGLGMVARLEKATDSDN